MTGPLDYPVSQSDECAARPADELRRQCELLWNAGSPPDVRALVGPDNGLPAAQIVEALRVDQHHRWRLGEPKHAHCYFQEFPELHQDPEAAFDLLWSEYYVRKALGDTPDLDHYLRDYPQFASLLRRQHEVLRWIEEPTHTQCIEPKLFRNEETGRRDPDDSAGRDANDFVILEEIGRGTMGVVYKARQPELDRLIAVKMILAGHLATEREISRFRREARSVARIDHPGIVRIYGFRWVEACPCLMMELVDGFSLAQRLSSGPLPQTVAAIISQRMAEAIQVAHASGVIHRDLKPANVLIDRTGVPKIVDFGLGKRLDEQDDLSSIGQVVGTASYMAPEQAMGSGKGSGLSSDVYSLGAVLYEMLTGRPPFQAATIIETLRLVVEKDPVPVRQLNPCVDRDLETICMKCLRKEPHARYDSAQALVDDLTRYQGGEPINARPVGVLERSLKWAHRRPSSTALALISVVCLILIAAFFSWRESRLKYETFFHVGDLEAAPIADVPRIIDRLRAVHPREVPLLEAIIRRPSVDQGRRLRAELALLPYRTECAEIVFQHMLIAQPEEQGTIRPLLERSWTSFRQRLQAALADPNIGSDRKLRAAAALIGSRQGPLSDRPWELLKHSPDPQFRTDLIHWIAASRVDPSAITQHLAVERDVTIRRALLQVLGENNPSDMSGAEVTTLPIELEALYRDDPDPGVHASVWWLLKRWGRTSEIQRSDRIRAPVYPAASRRWYLNSQDQTMMVIVAPAADPTGKPNNSGAHDPSGRVVEPTLESFAIAMTEVTWGQFWRFQPRHRPRGARRSPGPNDAVYDVDFPMAVAYCEWLSQKEALLRARAYRLPTQAEWTYASAAGAATGRYYGDSDETLRNYAQYFGNAMGHVREVGLLKPNELGLFDTLGNVNEWCSDTVTRDGGRVLHVAMGGSATTSASSLQTDRRMIMVAEASPLLLLGFRIARSL